MPRFTAHYHCPKCGASICKTVRAATNRGAIDQLPRYALIIMLDCKQTDTCKLRRSGGIFKEGDTGK